MTRPPRSPLTSFVRAFWILLQNPLATVLEAGLALFSMAAFLAPLGVGYYLLDASLGPGESFRSWGNAVARAVAAGRYRDPSLTPIGWSLLALLVTTTLAFLLACAVKAGITGAVAEIDTKAGDDSTSRRDFRAPATLFFQQARKWFWPVFWLLNIYAAAISIFIGIFFISLGWLGVGILTDSWVAGAIAVVLSLLLLTAAGLFLRLLTFAAVWRIVRFGDGVLDSVQNAWNRLAATVWHTVAAWCVVLAAGTVVAAILSIPRVIVQFFIKDLVQQLPLFIFWLGLTVVLQALATALIEVLQTAALVSVWNGRSSPPVGFENQILEPEGIPADVTPPGPAEPEAPGESLPFPEAALPPEEGSAP